MSQKESYNRSALIALLNLLASDRYILLQPLSAQLELSSQTVEQQIQALQERGVKIEYCSKRGYRLIQPLSLLNDSLLQSRINKNIQLEIFPELDSTNQYILDKKRLFGNGDVCLAEYQTAGRGRRGRSWVASFAQDVCLSMNVHLKGGFDSAMGLSLVVGLAIARTLEHFGVEQPKLKWPNDVYVNNRKLAGVLIEMYTLNHNSLIGAVIGIGLNLNMNDDDKVIDQPWTSLDQILPKPPKRNEFIVQLINYLHLELDEFKALKSTPLPERWKDYDQFLDKLVSVISGKQVVTGIAQGVDERGALLVDCNGELRSFIGGEISLRASNTKGELHL